MRNDLSDPNANYDRGAPRWKEAAWYLTKCLFFLSPLPWPSAFKMRILRLFGAEVGVGVLLKPRVNIHMPWRLRLGDYACIGEEVYILNFAPVDIGSHAYVSQRAFLCTGNHDFRDVTMPYRNRPIRVGDGAWVGAQAFIAPGVTVGLEAVVAAGSVALKDVPPGRIFAGNPCVDRGGRWGEAAS